MTAMPGTLPDLLDQLAATLERDAAQSADQGHDQAVALVRGRLLQTIGNLHLYEFFLPPEARIGADLAASLLLGEEAEPTEGIVLFQEGERLVLQVFDAIGEVVPHATLVQDVHALVERRFHAFQKCQFHHAARLTRLDRCLQPAKRRRPARVGRTVGEQQQGAIGVRQ